MQMRLVGSGISTLFDLMTVDDGYHRPIEGAWTISRVAVREEARGTGPELLLRR